MTSFAQVSLDSPLFQSEAVMQSIDSDVERMNFKLVSVESSIRRMLAQRRPGDSENSGSWYANHAKSRKVIADAASDLLISRKKQQDKLIRLRLKRDLEHERMLISDVAVPDMKLSRKTAALVTASRKKLFEKKIQLVKLNSELKNMNLQSVISPSLCIGHDFFRPENIFRLLRKYQTQMSRQNSSSTKKTQPTKSSLPARPKFWTYLQSESKSIHQ
jgi:hypothetical protein